VPTKGLSDALSERRDTYGTGRVAGAEAIILFTHKYRAMGATKRPSASTGTKPEDDRAQTRNATTAAQTMALPCAPQKERGEERRGI
jgi:hypothetical protein